jgi:2,4-dichlorophenol 6-monooxygenase
MLLLTGKNGQAWKAIVEEITESSVPIDVATIGADQLADETGDWSRISEIGDTGAILVRPDQHIAWRSIEFPRTAVASLRNAIARSITPDAAAYAAESERLYGTTSISQRPANAVVD